MNDCIEQRSPEWYAIRLGKFTSSEVIKLLKSGTRKMTDEELANRPKGERRSTVDVLLGDGAITYILDKVAEVITKESKESYGRAIDWGIANEPDARSLYEIKTKRKVSECGFSQYNEFFGGSPDGETIDETELDPKGIIEIKCPENSTNHIKYMLMKTERQFQAEYEEHYAQMQGNMLATGAGWCDFISYDPRAVIQDLQIFIIRIHRNEPFIEDLKLRIDAASELYTDYLEQVLEKLEAA